MNSDWVDCKDRMPPCGKFVLAYCAHAPIWSVVRWGGYSWENSQNEEWIQFPEGFFSHWIPLSHPQKPKGPFRSDKMYITWDLIYSDGIRDWRIGLYGIEEETANALPNWINDRLFGK